VASVLSVNVAESARWVPFSDRPSGIGKAPTDASVEIRDPGPKDGGLGSGVVGDVIGDPRHHGGVDQAVYAYARESLDAWEASLGRPLPHGYFGENLTTRGLGVDEALIGERWQIGDGVVLQVTCPRIPCATFRGWVGQPGWLTLFTKAGRPGAYLRVVTGGSLRAGDPVAVVHRPTHDVSVSLVFRALTTRPDLLSRLLAAGDDLPDDVREMAESGRTFSLDP
jgi:MOSC domain-containing protein YiiM